MNRLDQPVELAEVRLLQRARRREDEALALLWARVVDPAWSIARALLPEAQAVAVLADLRLALTRHAPGLPATPPWTEVVFGLLWQLLWGALELPPGRGIRSGRWGPLPALPPPPGILDPATVRRAFEAAPKELQVIHLFTVFAHAPAAVVAAWSGVPEPVVREGRAILLYRLAGGQVP